MPSLNIAIIGAGAAGLAAAWDLARTGHNVTVFEAGAEVGGLAAGFKDPAWEWSIEKFYHHWFATDRAVLDLIAEIGHSDKVIFRSPTTSVWRPEGAFPMDRAVLPIGLLSRVVNVLGIPGLSLLDKLRLGAVGFLLTKYHNGVALEKHTAEAWLRRWMGTRVYDLLWRPLLIGKFSALYDQVNMAWMWARLYKRTAQLGTYAGGFQAMLDDLAAAVTAQGATLRLNAPVQKIERSGDGLAVTVDGQALAFDRVLSTVGPGLLLRMVPDLAAGDAAGGDYAARVRALQSYGAVVVVLALDRQLMTDGTYWLNLPAVSPDRAANPFPFLGLVEHTNYMDPAHYGGDRIVYLGDYLPNDHEYFRISEDELAERFLPSLTKVNPAFDRSWIRRRWVFRAPYAQPIPLVDHSRHIPPLQTPLPGLVWASMSQVYPWDRGTNYAVEIGRRAARLLVENPV